MKFAWCSMSRARLAGLNANDENRIGMFMVRKIILLFSTLVVMISTPGCGSEKNERASPTPTMQSVSTTKQPLTLFGPVNSKLILSSLEPIMELSGLPYEIRIVEGLSVDAGIQGIQKGTLDIMILMQQPQPGERVEFFEVARTPVAIFVHPDAGIDNLSHAQVEMIFAGEVTNWSEVGGSDLEITVLVLPENHPLTQAMRGQLFGETPFAARAQYLSSESSVVDVVEGLSGTIGYTLWAGKKHLEFKSSTDYQNAIRIDGLASDDPNYPYVTSIGFAYLLERQMFLQPMLDWIGGFLDFEAAQLLATQFGVTLIDTSPSVRP